MRFSVLEANIKDELWARGLNFYIDYLGSKDKGVEGEIIIK